jgi:hypothetical protein
MAALERQGDVAAPAGITRTAFQPRINTPLTNRTTSTPKKTGGFTSSSPIISSRTLVAPNAAHIYDKKDFGKYK